MPTPDQQPTVPATRPPGYTWEGTVEDVAARLTTGGADTATARARALGAISNLAIDGIPFGATPEDRLGLVAHILAALDLIERRWRQSIYRSAAAEQSASAEGGADRG